MVHEARNARKDQVSTESRNSIKENTDLLTRLENDELMFMRKTKSTSSILSVSDGWVSSLIGVSQNIDFEDIVTCRNTSSFSISVYPLHYKTTQMKTSDPILIGE